MTADYALHVYNTSGTLQARLTDFLWLRYLRTVNAPGLLEFELYGAHDLLGSLQDNWELELWRRPQGGSWAQELVARHRDETWSYRDALLWNGGGPGILSLLGTRTVAWAAGTTNRSKFTSAKAETVMKTLVTYNAGSSATTGNGRKRTGTITGLTVQSDGANGSTVDLYCHGDNLLQVLQELATTGGGDFDLVRTGAGAYNFRWYTGQLGTDRTATVLFALERGNMARPVYSVRASNERTVACVWGQGTGENREYVTRTGPDYSGIRDSEITVDARDVELGNTAALQARGDMRLKTYRAETSFTFDPIETDACRYGEHYYLGDLVKAKNPYTGALSTLKIARVQVTLSEDGEEEIKVEVATP